VQVYPLDRRKVDTARWCSMAWATATGDLSGPLAVEADTR
jgi:hypothetical protein